MLRRLFKTGNSVVISLPKEVLDGLGVMDGENVSLEFDREQRRVILTAAQQSFQDSGIDADFARQVNAFIDHYRTSLEELAK